MRKSAKQPSIVEHFDLEDRDARPIPYSDKAFKTAALEWLIETNQVLTHQFHFYVVLICTTFTAHPSVQERHVQEDARHCISSQSGHSPSLTQAVNVMEVTPKPRMWGDDADCVTEARWSDEGLPLPRRALERCRAEGVFFE